MAGAVEEDMEGSIEELVDILDGWRGRLSQEIPVGGLLSRCPIAYKWIAPFRCVLVREALLHRMLALGNGVVLLASHGQPVGARILLRTALEATALLEYTRQRIDALVKGHIDWDAFGELTTRFVIGSRITGDVAPIHVLKAVEDANKTYDGLLELYNTLSETVHPNYDGLVGSYVRIDHEEHVAYLGDFAQERFGRLLVPYAGYVFIAFQCTYNDPWIRSMEALEKWLRDNDEHLERLQAEKV